MVDASGTLALAGMGMVLRVGLGSMEHDPPDSLKLVLGPVELAKLGRSGLVRLARPVGFVYRSPHPAALLSFASKCQ